MKLLCLHLKALNVIPALVGSVALAATLITATGAASQTPPNAAEQSTPTISVYAREVVLDVVVTDSKGQVVTNLNRDDFTVYEDAAKQTIRSFTPPSAHEAPADAPVVHSSADLKKIGDEPVTILVLDELDTRFEDMAYAREAMEKYLQRQPAQLAQPTVLLVVSDNKFDVLHDYCQDRDALLTIVKKHFPSLPFLMAKGGNSGIDASERMVRVLGALTQIAQASSGTRGRKNIIWVGAGFPSVSTDEDSANAKYADELNEAIKDATQILLDSRVTLNVIDPTMMADSVLDTSDPDIIGPEDLINATDASGRSLFPDDINFVDFAPATGGFAYSLRNDVDTEIADATRNGANYFTLTYSPTNASDDPLVFRKIRIAMNRPGLTANTRTGYYREPQRRPEEKPPAPPVKQLAFDLTNAALTSIVYDGLDVKGEPSKGGYTLQIPGKSLATWIRPDGSTGVEVTVMSVCFDARGHVLTHTPLELRAPVPKDPSQEIAFQIPMTIPQRTTRIRFVVRDASNGKMGTLDVKYN